MEAEYLILADGAQVVSDKLYMLGGGWSLVNAQQFPLILPMAVCIGIRVSWTETNRRHQFKLEVKNEDGGSMLFSAEGEFDQGRPAGIPAGIDQYVHLALSFPAKFEQAGQYIARLLLNGHDAKRVPFMVIARGAADAPAAPSAPS